MSIGQRIKERRIELGLSVDELAKRLGKNRATVYRYESDDIKDLPLSVLEPLASALLTTPADLMGYLSKQSLRPDEQSLLYSYNQLNEAGKEEARQRVQEMTEIKRFTQEPSSALFA